MFKLSKILPIVSTVFALVALVGVGYLYALPSSTWVGPTATAPYENVSAPINSGLSDQIKDGGTSFASLGARGLGSPLPFSTGEDPNKVCFGVNGILKTCNSISGPSAGATLSPAMREVGDTNLDINYTWSATKKTNNLQTISVSKTDGGTPINILTMNSGPYTTNQSGSGVTQTIQYVYTMAFDSYPATTFADNVAPYTRISTGVVDVGGLTGSGSSSYFYWAHKTHFGYKSSGTVSSSADVLGLSGSALAIGRPAFQAISVPTTGSSVTAFYAFPKIWGAMSAYNYSKNTGNPLTGSGSLSANACGSTTTGAQMATFNASSKSEITVHTPFSLDIDYNVYNIPVIPDSTCPYLIVYQ